MSVEELIQSFNIALDKGLIQKNDKVGAMFNDVIKKKGWKAVDFTGLALPKMKVKARGIRNIFRQKVSLIILDNSSILP